MFILELLKSVLYGIVEGVTEWLPISSTGHLILLEDIIPFSSVKPEFFSMFEVVIQLGAIIAVILIFWTKLWPFKSNKSNEPGIKPYIKMNTLELWLKVVIASLPAAIIGLPIDDWLDAHLYNKITVAIMLIVYGVLFIVIEYRNKGKAPKINALKELNYSTAAIIGCFQVLAMIPGTSRSGATILGAILIGIRRPVAAEFSFFLAIPTMAGASFLKIVKYLNVGFTIQEISILLVGMVVSFFVSLVAIKGLMSYVKRKDFSFFGYYRIVLGIIVLLFALIVG